MSEENLDWGNVKSRTTTNLRDNVPLHLNHLIEDLKFNPYTPFY